MTVDGKAEEVAVEGERVKEASGWISGCIGMGLSWAGGWFIAMSAVGVWLIMK